MNHTTSKGTSMRTLTLVLLLISGHAYATEGKFRIRARENYQQVNIEKSSFQGFSHCFNIWYEKPFDYALGLATGSFLTYFYALDLKDDRLNSKIKLLSHGLELKYWFYQGLFSRQGLYYQQFNGESLLRRDSGIAGLVGLGYEFNFSGVGLAFELDYRRGYLKEFHFKTQEKNFALGVHFYKMI